jgi:hypothetical protein
MAYVMGNPKSKAQIKRLLTQGAKLTVWQPGLGDVPVNGRIDICGPHYPAPHVWYGTAIMKDGYISKVI